ncbi:MAG TPA: hypothetical protein VEC99_12895 [Clostridia bacterium]|nr:hypothetical protein [Clostridia bacterium]
MELHIERPLELDRVEELRVRQYHQGGSFVVYLSCSSMILLTFTTPTLVWVSPGQNRRWRGIAHSMSSLLVGWWSFGGVLNTLLVLAHNGLGGFDLTRTIMDPRTQDGECRWEEADLARVFRRRRFALFLILVSVGILFVAPMALYLLLDVVGPRWLR